MDTTLTIIKPDAVANGDDGDILAHLEREGFHILGVKRLTLSRPQAQAFYEVHRERPFYDSLCEFMTSGPVVVALLAAPEAVPKLRKVMGATDPAEADEGTIRALYATSIEKNAIHGSDSDENAAIEKLFFFSRAELIAAGAG